ncbi:GTP-binding protein [Ilumatobacter sp.]|uniref:GTP-binding protein n=1 Tax=Ilumatobacter sp. TaxID=1967498 RepID=UPI003B52EFA6
MTVALAGSRSEHELDPSGPVAQHDADERDAAERDAAERDADERDADERDADEHEAAPAHTFKILVTGPFAAGKTSLIRSVSQTDVVSTDVGTSGEESDVKAETTVAMDFGTYHVPDDEIRLLLFGTPGQPRFRFMTDVLKGEVDVVAFVVDARARATHAAAGVELRSLLADLGVPAVIAVNRCDDADVAARIVRSLGAAAGTPVVPCQLVDPDSGREVVVEILLTLLDSMDPVADADGTVAVGS